MPKRRNEAPHESRIDYAASSSSDTNNNMGATSLSEQQPPLFSFPGSGRAPPGGFARADPAEMSKRRMISKSTASPAASDGGVGSTSSGRSASTATGGVMTSRDKRRKLYLSGIAHLNKEFATWASAQQKRLTTQPQPTTEDSPDSKPLVFFTAAAKEYIRLAADLKARYDRTHGDVLTFGTGDCGQICHGEMLDTSKIPRVVPSLRNAGIILVACGGLHNAALAEDGKVYSWGCNDDGSLGNVNAPNTAYSPVVVKGFLPSSYGKALTEKENQTLRQTNYEKRPEEIMTWAAAGDCQTLTLSTTGNVYMFGSYKDKEGKQWRDCPPPDDTRLPYLNAQKEIDSYKLPPRYIQQWPVHVYGIPGKVTQLSCGNCYNAAILDDDSMVTWGIGECGELARPVEDMKKNGEYDLEYIRENYLKPKPPVWNDLGRSVKRAVESISCGGYHLLVVAREEVKEGDGGKFRVYTSGLNNYGQLGHGDTKNRDKLTRVEALDDYNIDRVAGGIHHSLVVSSSGKKLFSFGRGDSGQLGITDDLPPSGHFESKPVRVHLDSKGNNPANNNNDDDDEEDNKNAPVISQISCGANHNLVRMSSGEVYSWGYGDMAQLGHGKEADEYRPKKINLQKSSSGGSEGKVEVHHVAGGGQHSAIILTRGQL